MTGLREVFSCDLRSLALMRVALGVALLIDLAERAGALRAHYTDAGVLPRALLAQAHGVVPSLYMFGGSTAFVGVGFVIAALAAVGLCLGYRTRWMAFASWLLLASLHARNPLLVDSEDRLLLVLVVLAWLLPCAARYSVDAALAAASPSPNADRSLASAVLVVQVTLAFAVSGIAVVGGAGVFATLAPGWGYLLAASALLLLCPWRHAAARLLAAAVLATAALAIPGTETGLLAASVPGVALAALLPGSVWPVLHGRLARLASPAQPGVLHIYYDRDCGFCYKICLLLRSFLLLGDVPITPAQAVPAVYRIMQAHNTWVVYDHDASPYIRLHAVLLLVRRSPLFWPLGRLATVLGVGTWGDGVYALVAANRGRLSRVTRRLLPLRALPRAGRGQSRLAGVWAALAGLALVLDLGAALGTGAWRPLAQPVSGYAAFAAAGGLRQHWRLFQPPAGPRRVEPEPGAL